MKKIRVLHAVTIMDRGGLENFIMNVYRNIDKEKFEFDFLVQRDKEGMFDKEIKSLGGNIYHIPPFNPLHHIRYLKEIDEFFKNNAKNYDIIHAHNNMQGMYVLRAAKKYGIKVRISHSHLAKYSLDYKIPFFMYAKSKLKRYCNVQFACGEKAGKWLFHNNNSLIIPNAIDLNNFNYNEKSRRFIRNKYNLKDNDVVIGHVGRFNKAKNHIFMIKIIEELLKENSNYKLMFVGSGESEENKIKKLVKEKNLEKNVIFTGSQEKVYDYLSSMDLFLFPSINEGLPVSLIEAQANGLQCVVSSSVPNECKITSLITFINLKDNIKKWCDTIKEKSSIGRKDELQKIKDAGFEIKSATKKLEKEYKKTLIG